MNGTADVNRIGIAWRCRICARLRRENKFPHRSDAAQSPFRLPAFRPNLVLRGDVSQNIFLLAIIFDRYNSLFSSQTVCNLSDTSADCEGGNE
ncbi:hypothetical protein [Aquamicrobium ahrensii]|uniref:Uncharacterized protein n=1 Tax=Aquamicrobium ahrensii TaxID=469551 RepID=A0ABV2KSR8_9HYPH